MPKMKPTAEEAAEVDATTTAPEETGAETAQAEAPADKPAGKKKPSGTEVNPKTGKIMTAEDKRKAQEKLQAEADKRERIQQREEAAARKKAEREEKAKEREEKARANQERAAAKLANKDMDTATRNAVADLLLLECQAANVKSPSLRQLITAQGERLAVIPVQEGEEAPISAELNGQKVKLQVLDARGANPLSVAGYLELMGEDAVATIRKSQKKRKTGWPKREPKPRTHPRDHGVLQVGARESVIVIDGGKPWASFPMPEGVLMNVHDAVITANMVGEGEDEKMAGLRLTVGDGRDFGPIDREAVRTMGRMIGFKVDFIDKLSSNPALATQVVNHMVGEYRPQLLMFATDGGRVRDVCPGWREVAQHQEVCQAAWGAMTAAFGNDVEVRSCNVDPDGHLEFVLTIDLGDGQVTPAEGDYLKAGVRITHRYGNEIRVGLFVERLVCKNGMTSESTSYPWTAKGAGTVAHQLNHVAVQIGVCMDKFRALVGNARKMAATQVTGDPIAAIKERMKQMGVPPRHMDGILEAFNQEPGTTEWHMLNAITRFASHTLGIGRNLRDALMEGSGEWVQGFDVVKARMPRSIANRVGAEIIQED